MAQSLFEHGQIRTTLSKAKDLRPFVERLITLARKARGGSLAARQRLVALLEDRAMIPADYQGEYEDMSDAARQRVLRMRSGRRHRFGEARGGQKFTAISVVQHLIREIAGRYESRPGGYTRIIKVGRSNRTDGASMAVLQLVGEEESPGSVTRPEKTARRRRAERRYAAAAKALKASGSKQESARTDAQRVQDQPAEESGTAEAPSGSTEDAGQADADT
jgi:large subunit ribosomal protein L17